MDEGEKRIISSGVFLTYQDHGFIGPDKGISIRRHHFRPEDQSWIVTRHFGVTNVTLLQRAFMCTRVIYVSTCIVGADKAMLVTKAVAIKWELISYDLSSVVL